MERSTEYDSPPAEAPQRRRRLKDHVVGVVLLTFGVIAAGDALLGQDFVGILQGLGLAGIGLYSLRQPLPIDLDLRETFKVAAGSPPTVGETMLCVAALTLVFAGALGRLLEWLWY